MRFLAGTELKPETISDIPAYNRENGKNVEDLFGPVLACWFAWAFLCMENVDGIILCLPFLVLAGGMWWLIWEYRRIERKYCFPY